MKTCKSYSTILDANKSKMEYIENLLADIASISEDIFDQKDSLSDSYNLYHTLRKKYPKVPSKILQNYIRFYQTKKHTKKPLKPGIYLNQDFTIKFFEGKGLTDIWLRFSELNFPLFGKHILEKIEHPDIVKQVHIFKKKSKVYCRLIVEKEIDGCKLNPLSNKSESLSNVILTENTALKIPTLKRGKTNKKFYRQMKDLIHKLTSKISSNLQERDVEVLHIEDEKILFKSLLMSASNETKYAMRFFPLRTFKNILIDKCLNNGIAYLYAT